MKSNKTVVLVGILATILAIGWYTGRPSRGQDSHPTEDTVGVTSVSPQEFAQLAQNPDAFILDVHTPRQTAIPGTDAFIPDDQLVDNLDLLPTDKNTPILVYCRSGNMSQRAARELLNLGYQQVYDLAGGTQAYREQQISVQLWPESQDLGMVIYGDVAFTNYTLTNYSPLPLRIKRVSTSCGCTQAKAKADYLEPYTSTEIEVTFDPAVHQDDTDMGELVRTIYLETDNPNYSELSATFTANVVKN
jgi:rhodanese-related sulfurtransferase